MRARAALGAIAAEQRPTLLLWAPVALGLGIAAYFSRAAEPSVTLSAALALAGLAALALAAVRPRLRVLALLGLACLGFATAKLQTERLAAPVLAERHFGPVAGRVVDIDRSSRNRLRLTLDRVHIPGLQPSRTPARVRVVLIQDPDPAILTPGARVMMRAGLSAPPPPVEPHGFDFRRWAWFSRLGAIGYAPEPVVLERPLDGTGPWLFRLRLRLADAIRAEMPGPSGGFAAAILTGDRSGVDPRDLVDLRASNLAHLLAISGLHMGLLTGTVFFLVRLALSLVPGLAVRHPLRKHAALAALAAGAGYLALSGAGVATQRAFVMAAVIFAAVLADRPALTLRAVAIAALIVLAWQPVELFGPGFQMSFAATVALIAGYGALRRQSWWQGMQTGAGRLPRAIIAVTLTSALAGLATAPYGAFHFNQVARYGLLANILAVPAMGLVVMPGALLGLALWPLGMQGAGFAAMGMGIAHIRRVAHWVAGLDGALSLVPTGPPLALALVSLGGLALAILRGPVRWTGAALALLGLGLWLTATRPDVLVDPEGKLVGVASPAGRILNRPRGAGFAARVWLENDGDPADQPAAHARAAPAPEGFAATLSDGTRILWHAGAELPADVCRRNTLLIAPKAPRPEGPCRFLGARALAQDGAHAFRTGHLDTPTTAAAVTGDRPWTHPSRNQ